MIPSNPRNDMTPRSHTSFNLGSQTMCVGVLTTRGLLTVAADGPTACIDSFHEPYRRFPHAIVLHHSTPEQAYAACKQQDHDVSAAQSVKPNFALGQNAGCAEDVWTCTHAAHRTRGSDCIIHRSVGAILSQPVLTRAIMLS
jgi:hypothetical protein